MNRVSVVIPCYNQGQYLSSALQSCARQTRPPDEIIVVDDGSDSSHVSLIEAAITGCPQPVRLIAQQGAGVSRARNDGWRASSGDYIQFLDADDVLLPGKIARCLDEFGVAPDAAVVYTDYETRTADLTARAPHSSGARPIPEHNSLAVLLGEVSTFLNVGCALIRRDWLERVGGFRDGLRTAEDWLLWVALACHGARFRFIPEVLFWYRQSPKGASRDRLNMAMGRLQAYEALRELPIPPGTFDLSAALADRHHMVALRLWEVGRAAEARDHFRQAISLCPAGRLARRVLCGLSYVTQASSALRLMYTLESAARRITPRGPR